MAVCEVYSQTVTFKYKSTLCSKSAAFSLATTILSFLLPLLVAYRSHGFWLKNSEFREQPDVHFKYDYLMYMETDQPDHPILCSTLPYTREFDHCSVVKSREEDRNSDGKFDELIFEISVDVPENLGVYSVQLILLFDYVLKKKCLLQMESLGVIQYNSGLPGFKFHFVGDLRLVQKQLLTTRGRDLRYNQPIFSNDKEFIPDLNLNEIITNYAKRNISTILENAYQSWASGVLLDEPFSLKININYPEEIIMYKPSFWQVMKWAWIQYFSLLFIFLNIFQRIKGYVFRNHIVPTIKEVPWEELQDINMSKIFRWVASSVMIFGGIAPYIPQYREIKNTENADGFSMYVCLALLLANTLRILFWFGKRYELPLLLQSFFMNITMLVMIRLCVQMKNKKQTLKRKERVFTDFDSRYFWLWTDFQSYLDFLLVFSIVTSFIMYCLLDSPVFVELVGFLAAFAEAMLGMPQLFQNFWNKSTKGMSVTMVLMWACGDIFKTVYFLAREAPFQFWVCGILQVSFDFLILLQVYLYKNNDPCRKD